MGRDIGRDGLLVGRVLSGFLREAIARTGPITKEHLEARRNRVVALKEANPGLDARYAAMLDEAVNGLVEAFREQQRRGR
jgi:hypothetical protein